LLFSRRARAAGSAAIDASFAGFYPSGFAHATLSWRPQLIAKLGLTIDVVDGTTVDERDAGAVRALQQFHSKFQLGVWLGKDASLARWRIISSRRSRVVDAAARMRRHVIGIGGHGAIRIVAATRIASSSSNMTLAENDRG
jgi:hypothetical protein